MPAVHHFEAKLAWRAGGQGTATSNHRVEFEGRPPLELSAAPQFQGDPSRLTPEDLFVASLASCQALSYLALAARGRVTVHAYDDHAIGTLTIVDKKMRISEVVLRPRITIASDSDAAKARELVEAAHGVCFIANSVACAVRVEPDIVVRD